MGATDLKQVSDVMVTQEEPTEREKWVIMAEQICYTVAGQGETEALDVLNQMIDFTFITAEDVPDIKDNLITDLESPENGYETTLTTATSAASGYTDQILDISWENA